MHFFYLYRLRVCRMLNKVAFESAIKFVQVCLLCLNFQAIEKDFKWNEILTILNPFMRVKPTKLYLIVYKFNAYMLHAFSYFCEEKKTLICHLEWHFGIQPVLSFLKWKCTIIVIKVLCISCSFKIVDEKENQQLIVVMRKCLKVLFEDESCCYLLQFLIHLQEHSCDQIFFYRLLPERMNIMTRLN